MCIRDRCHLVAAPRLEIDFLLGKLRLKTSRNPDSCSSGGQFLRELPLASKPHFEGFCFGNQLAVSISDGDGASAGLAGRFVPYCPLQDRFLTQRREPV